MSKSPHFTPTPLSMLVCERLGELDIKQAEFCRRNTFDQGMLSRIQNSMSTNLSLESALRLALGLSVSPKQILHLIDRPDLHELVVRTYTAELIEVICERLRETHPEMVTEALRIIAGEAAMPREPRGKTRRRPISNQDP